MSPPRPVRRVRRPMRRQLPRRRGRPSRGAARLPPARCADRSPRPESRRREECRRPVRCSLRGFAITRSGRRARVRSRSGFLVPPSFGSGPTPSAGWIHQSVTPTTRGPSPRENKASVRLGTNETMRVGRFGIDAGRDDTRREYLRPREAWQGRARSGAASGLTAGTGPPSRFVASPAVSRIRVPRVQRSAQRRHSARKSAGAPSTQSRWI